MWMVVWSPFWALTLENIPPVSYLVLTELKWQALFSLTVVYATHTAMSCGCFQTSWFGFVVLVWFGWFLKLPVGLLWASDSSEHVTLQKAWSLQQGTLRSVSAWLHHPNAFLQLEWIHSPYDTPTGTWVPPPSPHLADRSALPQETDIWLLGFEDIALYKCP
jgi:hypothetical protein